AKAESSVISLLLLSHEVQNALRGFHKRPMETGAALRRRKLHILRSRLWPGAQSFRCSSSPDECDSHSSGTLSIFGDVHAAAENDCSPFRAHSARNSARLLDKLMCPAQRAGHIISHAGHSSTIYPRPFLVLMNSSRPAFSSFFLRRVTLTVSVFSSTK